MQGVREGGKGVEVEEREGGEREGRESEGESE